MKRPGWLRRLWRPGPRGWLAAALVALLGFLTLGLPGAVLFELSLALLGPFGLDAALVPPDTAWPVAIYLSLLWPLGIPLAAGVARRTRHRVAVHYALLALWCLGLSAVFYALAVRG